MTERDAGRRVRETTEEELLAQIFPLLPAGDATIVGPGDDSAVVRAPDGRFVVSTDVLVEGRHFRSRWSTGYDVGWRAAVQNLADVAAMGARPTSLVVSLVMPGDLPVAWVTDLARGLAAACAPSGAAVVGGDLSGGEQVVVAVTVHGDLEGREPVLRSGARPGDVLAHAGRRGWSAAGLALLDAQQQGADDELVGAYLRPDPPITAGALAADAGSTAMLDVSDGLLRDAGRLARASRVRLDLDGAAFAHEASRLGPAAQLLGDDGARTAGELVADWVLTGGEDHGLLATFPSPGAVPEPFRVVGRVLPRPGTADAGRAAPGAAAGDGPADVLVDGRAPRTRGVGWDHFGG